MLSTPLKKRNLVPVLPNSTGSALKPPSLPSSADQQVQPTNNQKARGFIYADGTFTAVPINNVPTLLYLPMSLGQTDVLGPNDAITFPWINLFLQTEEGTQTLQIIDAACYIEDQGQSTFLDALGEPEMTTLQVHNFMTIQFRPPGNLLQTELQEAYAINHPGPNIIVPQPYQVAFQVTLNNPSATVAQHGLLTGIVRYNIIRDWTKNAGT